MKPFKLPKPNFNLKYLISQVQSLEEMPRMILAIQMSFPLVANMRK
jgi:hypothetical protein